MIETLFVVNTSNSDSKEPNRRVVLPSPNQENRVLDPKKSQNIAILLRALSVTTEEVCEALLEGILFSSFYCRHDHTTVYVYHISRRLLILLLCLLYVEESTDSVSRTEADMVFVDEIVMSFPY